MKDKFTLKELEVWEPYVKGYFLECLNDESRIKNFIEDLESFRGSKYYTGTNTNHKKF